MSEVMQSSQQNTPPRMVALDRNARADLERNARAEVDDAPQPGAPAR